MLELLEVPLLLEVVELLLLEGLVEDEVEDVEEDEV